MASCDLFAAEYNLDVLMNADNQNRMLIPDGLHIKDLVTKAKYKRLVKQLAKSFNIDIEQLGRFLPLILVNVISEATLAKDYKLPLDMHLWRYAKSLELRTEGIESYESQLEIIRKIRLKDQIKMIFEIVRNPSKFRRSIVRMAQWYTEEEIGKLYKNGKKSLGKYKGILLTKRNFIMANRLEEMATENKTFFAVGAGHLAGKNGVLKILKDKGWKLKAI
jgi:uncharacterized protein YbaP (TraB family)